jgi:hypothetical protein
LIPEPVEKNPFRDQRTSVVQIDSLKSAVSHHPVEVPPRTLPPVFLATSDRASSASSTDRNFMTPRGYFRGARAQYLAQWRRNLSNPSLREALTGAAFISSAERYFSTAILFVIQTELLFEPLSVRMIQRPDGVSLEPVKRMRCRNRNLNPFNLHDH